MLSDSDSGNDQLRQRYYIPDNFIEEGRIFLGKFRLRYFAEACILSGAFALAALFICSFFPQLTLEAKASIVIVAVVPPFCMGIAGYNGDPISVVCRDATAWLKSRHPLLKNPHPRLLADLPLDVALSQINPQDKLVDMVEGIQTRRMERRTNSELIEGDDFVFAEDPDLDRYTIEERRRELERQQKKRRKKGKLVEDEEEVTEPVDLSYEELEVEGEDQTILASDGLFDAEPDISDLEISDDKLAIAASSQDKTLEDMAFLDSDDWWHDAALY